ncbi:hypothetical protein KY284_020048 [Solanum tuberosum]|nr:hypothetical protein KY284_020048 [Solanum tuberosum]
MVDAFVSFAVQKLELKQCGDQKVQQWVFEINSIANDVVAILETYNFEAGKGDDDGFVSRLKACACICRKETKFYNVREGPSNKVTTLRRTTFYVDDQDYIFVGFQDVVQTLLADFSKKSLVEASSPFMSTAQWIFIKNIIKSIQGCTKETLDLLERMTERDLEIYLRDLLKERKYLVVVDDVWQREAWESLKRAFPDSKNGSRVIITTRKDDVAKRVDDRGFVHKLRFLSKEESWDLFCRKLLDVRAMIPKMESLAKDIVEKCRGLPLAIVVLSGLLLHKKGLDEWQKVKDHLWKNISEDKYIEVSNILSLSYSDLSTALKQCFLYFGIFPEDKVVDAENIIWLWMDEGFIPRGEERMEDVVEGFLNELIRRSLIQVVDTVWEKVTECRVHDLLCDLAIQKALEVNFFDIYDPRSHSVSSLCIRHAIHSQGERHLSFDLSNLKLRKLYHLKFLRLRGIRNLPSSIGNLKHLQTLVVVNEGRFSCELPPETADLINLRHLDSLYSKSLKCLSKLTSLQVLTGVRCDQWKDVEPVDLVNLRELTMHDITKTYSLNNISSLKNLRTIKLFCKGTNAMPLINDLHIKNCRNLKEIPQRMKDVASIYEVLIDNREVCVNKEKKLSLEDIHVDQVGLSKHQ